MEVINFCAKINSKFSKVSLLFRYGDIMTVYLGSRCTVMLNSYDVIKEAFVKNAHVFSGRPQDILFIKEITEGYGKILFLFLECK